MFHPLRNAERQTLASCSAEEEVPDTWKGSAAPHGTDGRMDSLLQLAEAAALSFHCTGCGCKCQGVQETFWLLGARGLCATDGHPGADPEAVRRAPSSKPTNGVACQAMGAASRGRAGSKSRLVSGCRLPKEAAIRAAQNGGQPRPLRLATALLEHPYRRRFCLAAFSLTLSVLTVGLCQAVEKVPQRTPRQLSEEDGAGSRAPGVWSAWGTWSACSQPCGLGVLERTRACRSPYQRLPWAGRTQPPYQGERPASPYPGRPAYPLHTERNAGPALSFRGSTPALQSPLAAQNRHTRREDVPLAQSRDAAAPHSGRRRGPALPQAASPVPRPQGRDNSVPSRAASQRASAGVDRTRSAARSPLRGSIPLFKPARRDSHEDGPGQGSQADGGRFHWGAPPTPESPLARRSRVRESIKPGKYGYGKLPFSLPLHRDVAEGAAPRFKRHPGERDGEPPPPPPPPPRPPPRKRERKARRASSREELAGRGKEAPTPRTPRKAKALPPADGPARPQGQAGEGAESGSGHGRPRGGGEGPAVRKAASEERPRPTEPGVAPTPRNVALEEEEHRGKWVTDSPAPPGGAHQPSPEASVERPSAGPTDSPVPAAREGPEERGTATARGAPPPSQAPPPAGSRPPPAQGELRLTHQVLRNQSSAPERKGPGAGKSHRATLERQPAGAGHTSRSRNQRQNEPRPGSQGPPRASHPLFVDRPASPRPAEPDIWLLHRGSPVPFHARGQGPRTDVHPEVELPQWNLYYPGTETFHCDGESKQFKACRQEPCPPSRPDPRAVQCAAYNNQEFMGRLYRWEPFTDVRGSQRCELNCRPVGYRFYVRHTEKVQDGTPCETSSQDICSPGCDGILGSNRTLDSCGVCGGDHTACKLVVGNFSETDVPIGYHRILEIPAGATRIRVEEMTRSPNYLALRSHGGKSIINGNWAVNPPGRYEAAGTVFVYSRPGSERREGESLAAEGPTTEPIDVYMIFQQDNPGVTYQFFLASPKPDPSAQNTDSPRQEFGALSSVPSGGQRESPTSHARRVPPVDTRNLVPARPPVSLSQSGRSRLVAPPPNSSSQSGRSPGTLQRNVRVPPLPPPPPPAQHSPEGPNDFYWKRVGTTECSATCGKGESRRASGFWQSVYRCLSRISQEEVGEEKCYLLPKPVEADEACNTEPCPAYKSCGLGTHHRQVLCRQTYANRSTTVHPQRCAQLQKPNATQACQVQVCSHWEVRTNWSSCSVFCGTGHRTRHVRCVSNHGDLLRDSDCPSSHRPQTSEACHMGPCVRTWFFSDWSNTCSAECGTGIQRRSVVCLSSNASGPEEESCAGVKPADMRACNGGPCQRVTHWYRGPWSPCSADCGTGTQRCDVICVSKLGADFNVTDPAECAHLEKPPSLQPCAGTSCDARWFSTAWSACSRSCVGGVQVREVHCLTQNRTLSSLCPPDLRPPRKRPCNNQPCIPDLDENCRDKYHNCPVIVQARLCVYSYYKAVCCASCTHALERRHISPSR
ncbi:hypothetical protein lerEdw1_011531 [Lerista edwardsae]|nr:hypothetical protein lerEdw1_011531 [Lerista edwardsae]